MSQPAPCGRGTPRWSVGGQLASTAASMAGLPGWSAMVSVGPPLSWSPVGSSSGSWLMPGQLVSGQLRFPPPSAIGSPWWQFTPDGLSALFPENVVFVTDSERALLIASPLNAKFPEKALLLTVSVPKFRTPPPSSSNATPQQYALKPSAIVRPSSSSATSGPPKTLT